MERLRKSHIHAGEASTLYLSGHSVEAVAKKLRIDYRTAREAIELRTPLRDPSARLVGRTRPDKDTQ